MCGFMKPSTPKIDEGAALRKAEAEKAAREAEAAKEAEAKRQELSKRRGRASLVSSKTGATGVLGNKTENLFNDLS